MKRLDQKTKMIYLVNSSVFEIKVNINKYTIFIRSFGLHCLIIKITTINVFEIL